MNYVIFMEPFGFFMKISAIYLPYDFHKIEVYRIPIQLYKKVGFISNDLL